MDAASLTHHFCAFFRDGRLDFGWIRGLQKNRLAIQPLQGREQFLPPNRLLWSIKAEESDEQRALTTLGQWLQQARNQQAAIELPTIHSLLEPESALTLEELAELFLEEPQHPAQQLSLFLALQQDEDWFKRNRNNTYTPFSPEEQEQRRLQRERELAKQQREEEVRRWVDELEHGNWPPPAEQTAGQQAWVQQLRSLLTKGRESPDWKELSGLLGLGNAHEQADERQLRRLLAKAGSPVSWGELQLLKSQVTASFPASVMTWAEALIQKPLPALPVAPVERPSYTIDAAKTEDYDDAISVQSWTERSIELCVHIADLTQFIDPDDALFSLAEQRVSSVYTAERVYPMLPEVLSNDHFSLREQVPRAVMTFALQLFADGSFVLQEIRHEILTIDRNLTYDEVDQLVEQADSFWGVLHRCSEGLKQQRIAQGALNIERREYELDISDPDRIRIVPRDRNSPANSLVQELAVLVNRIAGEALEERNIPGIFRTQPPYELVQELREGEKLTMDHINIEAARLAVTPSPHSGLGCPVYMQVTSPIRRFVDLLCQWQLRQALRTNDALFTTDDLMSWAFQIEQRQKAYVRTEREIERYWKLRYLGQHLGETFVGRVRRELPQKIEIELEEIGFTFQMPGSFTKGTPLQVEVQQVDPEGGSLLAELQAAPANPTPSTEDS